MTELQLFFETFSLLAIPLFLLFLVVSLSFHEAMHAFTAHWLGDSTAKSLGRLTINPLKHIDLFTTILLPLVLILLGLPPFLIAKPVPFNPYGVRWGEFGAALVGLAGPLSNFLLAIVSVSLVGIFGNFLSEGGEILLKAFFVLNIFIFVFNMIPFPPLDGSRVLYAVAPDPLRRVMQQIESFGLMGIVIFMFLLFPFLVPIVRFINDYLIQLFLG